MQPAVYIMASGWNGTLYVGVTSDLLGRVSQHRTGEGQGFAAKYGCRLLVWYAMAATIEYAIAEEKRIKGGSRAKKIALIASVNPTWLDLYPGLVGG